jgi:hypothetical protein
LAFKSRINRPVVEETVAPGQTVSGTIEVENQGEEPLRLDLYLQDWEYLEGGSGEKLFSAPGSSPWSASSWISYYPQRLELPAHGKGLVDYTIRAPADASGGHYAVLFFESILARPPEDEEGVSVQYTGRLGSLFELEVAGTVKRTGEVAELAIGRPDEDRALTLGYTFLNTGNVAIRPKAYFNIVDQAGRYFGRGEFDRIYTFPGRSGSTTTEWTGGLAPGDYAVLLTVDLGGNEIRVAEQPLSVKRELAIEAVELHGREPLKADVTVHNVGHVQAQLEGTLTVEAGSGARVGSWPISETTLAPNERRQVAVGGSGPVAAGAYQCHVWLTHGGLTTERTLPCDLE